MLKEATVLPITAVKNLIKDVNNPELNMAVEQSSQLLKSPLATIVSVLQPSLENDIKSAASNAIANIVKSIDAVKKPEQKADPKQFVEDLKKDSEKLEKLLNEKANKCDDKQKKNFKNC